jgi:ElaA protein
MDGTMRAVRGPDLTTPRCTGCCACGWTSSSSSSGAPTPSWTAATSIPAPFTFVLGPMAAPLAYLRLLSEAGGERRIGRVCTAASARGRG